MIISLINQYYREYVFKHYKTEFVILRAEFIKYKLGYKYEC